MRGWKFSCNLTFLFAAIVVLVNSGNAQQTSHQSGRLSAKEIAGALTAAIRPNQAAISPDGTRVAWVQPMGGPEGPHGIFVAGISGASQQPLRVTAPQCNQCNEDGIAWSPDGRQLAFLSDSASAGQPQLYISDLAGSTARKLTNLTGYLADPKWSRDGKHVAILFTENAPRTAGPLAPMTPPSGVIDSKIFEQRLQASTLPAAKPNSSLPQICMFTNTTGRQTTTISRLSQLRDRATPTGTSRSFTHCQQPAAR